MLGAVPRTFNLALANTTAGREYTPLDQLLHA